VAGYPDDEPVLGDIAPLGADFSLNRKNPTVIGLSGRILTKDSTVKSIVCVVSRSKSSLEYSLSTLLSPRTSCCRVCPPLVGGGGGGGIGGG
jgi:hypothetical protein